MKPNKVYRKLEPKAFTRKKYMRRIPDSLIKKFTMGNTKRQDFPINVKLIVQKTGQISDSALESVRMNTNRRLEKELGPSKYRFHIHVIPHHFSREHGLVGVAKAERMAKGMRLGFGKINRRLARVKAGQTVITVGIGSKEHIRNVREILRMASKKLPFNYKIKVVDSS